VALTCRNTTGPPWSVTDADEQNNTVFPTLCVGGPVMMHILQFRNGKRITGRVTAMTLYTTHKYPETDLF